MPTFTPAMWLTLVLFSANAIFMAGGFCWLAFNHFRSMAKRMDSFDATLAQVGRDVAYLKGRASARSRR